MTKPSNGVIPQKSVRHEATYEPGDLSCFANRGRSALNAIMSRDTNVDLILGDLDRMARTSRSPQKALMLSLLAPPAQPGLVTENALYAALNNDPSARTNSGASTKQAPNKHQKSGNGKRAKLIVRYGSG